MDVLYQLSYLGLSHMIILAEFFHFFKADVGNRLPDPSEGVGVSLYTSPMEGLANYEKENRPWGNFERFTLNEKTTVKIITVNDGEYFSLQTHEHRDEFWHVIKGSGVIRIGNVENQAHEGSSFFCQRGTEHRVTGGPSGTTFLEIAFGDFDEGDIKRLEDKYGRS